MSLKKLKMLLLLLGKKKEKKHLQFAVLFVSIFFCLQVLLSIGTVFLFGFDAYMNQSDRMISCRQLQIQTNRQTIRELQSQYEIVDVREVTNTRYCVEFADYTTCKIAKIAVENAGTGQIYVDDYAEENFHQVQQIKVALIGFLAFLIGSILISSSMFVIQDISGRHKDIAILIAVGYSRKWVLFLTWICSFYFVLVGYGIGTLSGAILLGIAKIVAKKQSVIYEVMSWINLRQTLIGVSLIVLLIGVCTLLQLWRKIKAIAPRSMFEESL